MKKVLAAALMSTLCGICFALAVGGVLVVIGTVLDRGEYRGDFDFVQLPEHVRVVEHERVDGTPQLTIRGVIENFGDEEWLEVSVEAAIFAGEAQVNRCDRHLDGKLGQGVRRAFQIECYGVAGSNLPDNLSYRLTVRHARIPAG